MDRFDAMFGPVITTEAHLAFSGARTHSNNTAELTAMVEALAFFGPRGPVTPDEQSCIVDDSMHAAGISLGTIQDRTYMCSWHLLVNSLRFVFSADCVSPCNTFSVTVEISGNQCADHAACCPWHLWAYLEPQCHFALGSAHLRL